MKKEHKILNLRIDKNYVSNRALNDLERTMFKQDDYGISKYNTPLHHTLDYDWDKMADEEMADYLKYRQCARDRKQAVVALLRIGMESENPKEWMQIAIDTLTVTGTGTHKEKQKKSKFIEDEQRNGYKQQLHDFMQSVNPKPSLEDIEVIKKKLLAKREVTE